MTLIQSLYSRTIKVASLSAVTVLATSQAHAHHVMDGEMPVTFTQGLLSGLGHPVIGIDHLAFIIGVGLLAAVAGFGIALPLLFVLAMCGGLAIHFMSFNLPAPELLIAGSVLLIGIAIALRTKRSGSWIEGGLFAFAGVAHGYAFAESIVGAEQSPLAAYIIGLVVIQSAIAVIAYGLGRLLVSDTFVLPAATARVAGLAIATTGAYFVATATGLFA